MRLPRFRSPLPLRSAGILLVALGVLVNGCTLQAGNRQAGDAATTQTEAADDPIDAAQLHKTLSALRAQRPGVVDLYALGFAGDASDPVFRNEALYLEQLLSRRFDAAGHVVTLVNDADNLGEQPYAPLATYDNLYDALARLGKVMDPAEDVLLLFVSTHGTEDHTLYVQVSADEEDFITPADLRQALDDSGIRNRVIVLSACYSGGFIPRLKSPDTMIVTAARADRPSFGCGNTSNATYFGQAWLIDALNRTTDFDQAFALADREIGERERSEGEQPSLPQLWRGGRIGKVLAKWQSGLHAGAAVPYPFPPVEIEQEDEPEPVVAPPAVNLQAARVTGTGARSCD